jgi:predicted ArsR family transcriptional regulator
MTIEAFLTKGPATALQIRQALGITHEQVYERLVHLEALGIVRFGYEGSKPTKRLWRFA